jgi:hypothetical protein
MSGSQNACSYRGDVLALVGELNLDPTIKLILSRRNVQPMAHAAHSLFRAMRSRWTNMSFFLKSLNAEGATWACSPRLRGTRILAYSGVAHVKPMTAFCAFETFERRLEST